MWGGVDDIPNPPTVREQVEQSKQSNIDSHRPLVKPAPYVKPSNDPYILKWRVAEDIARNKKRKEWDNDETDFELLEMIRYCYSWIQDTGVVPSYTHDLIDLYWPRPKNGLGLDLTEQGITRRDYVVEKVRDFWIKSVSQNPAGIDLNSKSYRTILAARKLCDLIEKYADKYRNPLEGQTEKEIMKEIKGAAHEYFLAHFPAQQLGSVPGPLSTIDPEYVEYVQLCRKYNLKEGVLLHETKL
jgi:hypothetical protein